MWERSQRCAITSPDQVVASVRFATTERGYTLQNGTKVPDHTDWHNLVFYRKLAKVVEQYVHIGDKLYVEGRIRYRNYDDQRGVRHYVTEILVENMEMLSVKAKPVTRHRSPRGWLLRTVRRPRKSCRSDSLRRCFRWQCKIKEDN